MKVVQLVMIFSLIIISFLQGQDGQLILTDKSNGRQRYIEEGKKIRVFKSGYNKFKGILSLVDSSCIAIGKDTIPLVEIVIITALTKDSRTTGILLTTIGSLILLGGVLALEELGGSSSGGTFGPSGDIVTGGVGFVMLIGVGITSVGIGKLIAGTNYKSSKWAYTACKSKVSMQ